MSDLANILAIFTIFLFLTAIAATLEVSAIKIYGKDLK